MKTGFLLCLISVLVLQYCSAEPRSCKTSSECVTGVECCSIPPKYPFPSIGRDIHVLPGTTGNGTCMKYFLENETCNMFVFNGNCGCLAGLRCVFDKHAVKRSLMWSGRFLCKRQ